MINKVFGEVCFDTGFETKTKIVLGGQEFDITVSADAYFEKDGITEDQEAAYADFLYNQQAVLSEVKDKLKTLGGSYTPTLLLIKRNGDYGLVFDDENDAENGVVISIKPNIEIISVDQYF